eukprot:1266328-Rhodomonas_salina.5
MGRRVGGGRYPEALARARTPPPAPASTRQPTAVTTRPHLAPTCAPAHCTLPPRAPPLPLRAG